MVDMGHTLMSEEDEAEYEEFYDYARTYVNMGLEMKPQIKAAPEETKKARGKGDESDGSWEDCDLASGDEAIEEAASDEEEESKKEQNDNS
jgi:hypothetical protein